MELERTLRNNKRMVNRGVLDQEALLERVHDEVVIFNQLQLYHDIQETTE